MFSAHGIHFRSKALYLFSLYHSVSNISTQKIKYKHGTLCILRDELVNQRFSPSVMFAVLLYYIILKKK
jgi:hypothetical protein